MEDTMDANLTAAEIVALIKREPRNQAALALLAKLFEKAADREGVLLGRDRGSHPGAR
jgi:hypothetical protein